jgi:hypothetical protein
MNSFRLNRGEASRITAHNRNTVNARSKASVTVTRLIVTALCVSFAPMVLGQVPPNRTQTKPPVNETRGVNRPQIFVPRPTASTVPPLFGMSRNDVSASLERLHLRPMFFGPDRGVAVEQKPAAGTTVPYGSTVAVTLGQLPRLVLGASPAPATTASDLWLTVSFEPPLPTGTPVNYQYTWGDGTFMGPTADAVVTHRFSDVSVRVVSVVAFINDRVRIDGSMTIEVVAPSPAPPSDTGKTSTPDTTTTPTQTATVSDTSTTTATATRVDTGTTTTSSTEPGPASSDTTPTTPTTATTTTTGTVPTSDPSSNPLVWIGAAAVVLLLVVTFLLARVLRALNRKAPETHASAKSPVAFKGGVRAIEYEIEHPELIRKGPAVGLRGGIRAEEGDDV